MNVQLIDRVDTNNIKKGRKTLTVCAILLLCLAPFKIYFSKDDQSFASIGYWVDTIFPFIIAPGYILLFYRPQTKRLAGQCIEWWSDKIIYESKDKDKSLIYYEDIVTITIGMDVIDIFTLDSKKQQIDIENFIDYDTRRRIKSNFEQIILKNYTLSNN